MPFRFYNTNFSRSTCFLCAADIVNNSTSEDVFPMWLQRKFNLKDLRLNLLNGTSVPYRQLKIPCCPTCNNEYLSKVEKVVSEAFDKGHDEFLKINKEILFIWLSKIFYGLLYKEHFMPFNRKDKSSNQLIPKEMLTNYLFRHLFLTSVIRPVDFMLEGVNVPFSVFTYKIQTPKEVSARFDFRDDKFSMVMSLRLGDIGILVSFDGGILERVLKTQYNKYKSELLHPIQFEELSAQLFYRARLLRRTPKYMIMGADSGVAVIQNSMHQISESDFFEWNMDHYAQYLSMFTLEPVNDIRPAENKMRSWLHKNNSPEFNFVTLLDFPWRGAT